MNSLEIRDVLDAHIDNWRENTGLLDERDRQRAIDAVDALQRFRVAAFGALFPGCNLLLRVESQRGRK